MAATSMMDRAINDAVELAAGIFSHLDAITTENLEDALLRKLREAYDTLEIDELMNARAALGHKESEERPCKFCNMMAEKEIELSE